MVGEGGSGFAGLLCFAVVATAAAVIATTTTTTTTAFVVIVVVSRRQIVRVEIVTLSRGILVIDVTRSI